jgi:hypothetical protein
MSRLLSPLLASRGDLRLLRREPGFRAGGPLAGVLAGGQQLGPGSFGESPGTLESNVSCGIRSCSRASRRRR